MYFYASRRFFVISGISWRSWISQNDIFLTKLQSMTNILCLLFFHNNTCCFLKMAGKGSPKRHTHLVLKAWKYFCEETTAPLTQKINVWMQCFVHFKNKAFKKIIAIKTVRMRHLNIWNIVYNNNRYLSCVFWMWMPNKNNTQLSWKS